MIQNYEQLAKASSHGKSGFMMDKQSLVEEISNYKRSSLIGHLGIEGLAD